MSDNLWPLVIMSQYLMNTGWLISLIVRGTSPASMGTARIHSPGELYQWYLRISCCVLCLIWSTRWYKCGFIMTVTGSHVDQEWREGDLCEGECQVQCQTQAMNEATTPGTHLLNISPPSNRKIIPHIPDCVQSMQNVRFIKLMAINEGGWQGYKPPTSLVISLPDAWSPHVLNGHYGHADMTMFCPHLFPGAEITSSKSGIVMGSPN